MSGFNIPPGVSPSDIPGNEPEREPRRGGSCVFVLRDRDGDPCWHVYFGGQTQSPAFNSRGAAQAFLDALRRGTRKPEVAS